jgi:membrane protein required for colicin V production
MFIDLIVASLITIFFVIGILQGFIVSLLILAAWVIGILSAWLFSGAFGSMLNTNIEDLTPLLALFFGAVLAFLLPFLLIRIAALVANSFIKKSGSHINVINRLLGGALGALKGIVMAGIILTVINLLPVQGGLRQTMEKSIAYSIYKALPFANLWGEFKVPKKLEPI